MARNSSEVEQAVSRTLRDSLAKLQQTTGELDRAVSDLVSACASARPSNSLPPMLRARSAAAALAASLEVLSRFVITAMQATPAPTEQELQAIAPSAAATAQVAPPLESVELESPAPVEQPVEQIEPDTSAAVTVPDGVIAAVEASTPIAESTESAEAPPHATPVELPYAKQASGESPVTETISESPDQQMREPGPDQAPEPAPEREPGPEPLPQGEPPAEQPPNEMPEREPTPEPPPEQIPEHEPEREQAPELEPVAAFAQQEQPLVPEFANADPTSAPFAASYNEDESPNEESSSDAVSFDVLALAPEQQELHRRANRVAKVSMQDVKMLRPRDVALGKENKDLCIRLRDDIEKAHKEYDRRFHSIMDHPVDYFYNWMVQILGDGDPQTLGEYPYPSPVLRR